MSAIARWWAGRRFRREIASMWGFKTGIRRGEGFDQWLSRETLEWVRKGK